jgi:glucose-6-phosphate isomerase
MWARGSVAAMTRPRDVVLDATALVAAPAGPGDAGFTARAAAAGEAHAAIMARRARGELGFWDLPDDRALARACLDHAAALDPAIDTMVVLGIGGSSLGPRAAYSALAPAWDPLRPRSPGMPRRLIFPDNVDPVTFAGLLELLPLERTVWNVVTKSGGTAETCAQLAIVVDRLDRELGAERARKHVVATTDPAKGALRKLADARGWATFPVPANVGGRFSVLTAVGLLPAAVAGLDVTGLLDGARAMRDRCLDPQLATNPALALATLLHHHHVERGRPIVVMMSYVDALYDTADWFRQLWAESLGKQGQGPTPIAARGATDQHSQLQLYAEGPDDKAYLFLSVGERGTEVRVPDNELTRGAPDFAYLANRGLGELLDAELAGTSSSLKRRGRPVGSIRLARASAESLGALFMLLEAATAFAGPLYGVDPFDQPGVEEAKRLTFAALGRPGFEALREQIAPPIVDGPYVF